MAEFKTIFVSLILAGLFLFCMISFGVMTGQNNLPNQSIINDPRINDTYSKLYSNLTQLQTTAQDQRSNFEKENPTDSFGSLLFFSIVSFGRVIGSQMLSMWNVTFGFVFDVLLGITFLPVLTAVGGILLVVLVLYLWRLYRVG